MMRLIALALLLALACRWITGKWPWDYLRPAPTHRQAVFEARKLLGVGAHADAGEIRAAHRRISGTLHPDRGGATDRMQDLNAARDLLLNELPHKPSEPPHEP